jgi:hypothetical protein
MLVAVVRLMIPSWDTNDRAAPVLGGYGIALAAWSQADLAGACAAEGKAPERSLQNAK